MCSNECSGESDGGKCFFSNYAVEIVLKVANKNVMRYAVVTYAKAVLGLKNKPILVKIPHIYISYSIEVLIYKHADKLKYFRQFND